MAGSWAMFNGVESYTPQIIYRLVGCVCRGHRLGMPNGKSSSGIMARPIGLGMDMPKEYGSNGALLWAGWVAGLVGVCGCGGGDLTTLTVGTRTAFPSSFRGMTGLSIGG